jgi:hypothetical protein
LKKLRIVEIIFDTEIKYEQISAFRGAIASKAGKENILFHNHIDDGYRYSYPLIQYKKIGKNASIICIEEGVDEVYHFFDKPKWNIFLNDQEIDLKVKSLKLDSYNINVWDKFFTYKVSNWMGLNEENHKKFKSLDSLAEKLQLLENLLVANILSFGKGVDWFVEKDKKIEVKISSVLSEKLVKYKKTDRLLFDLQIKTNVFLPPHIGLGKATSQGFGVVYKVKTEEMN